MKNKSKYTLLLFFIFSIFIFCIKSTNASAKTIVNNNLQYELNDNEKTAVLVDGTSSQGNIEIPSEIVSGETSYNVTTIADKAFYSAKIEGIIIPESVNLIGKKAFYECKNLLVVSLPKENLKIDDYAFYGSSLTDIKIPDGTTYLGNNIFSNCDKLKTATITGNVEYIPSNAFSWCTNLEKVELSNGIKEIQDMAFYHCTNLNSIDIPDSVTFTLGNSAFEWCKSLKTIKFPENLTAIGNRTFNHCNSLESVIIPAGISYIGEYAFNNCDTIEYMELPESINYIGSNAFGNSGNNEETKIQQIVCVKNSYVDNEKYFYSWSQYGISYPEFSYVVSDTSVSGSIFGEYTFMAYISVVILLIIIGVGIVTLFNGKKKLDVK